MNNGLITGKDGKRRCWWCGDDPQYMAYHDQEWGKHQDNDIILFEKICLEGFQSGLSWLTILRKRENFRNAFCHFDFKKISSFNDQDIERLLQDEGIVRHRGKIEATVNNAKQMLVLIDQEESFYKYLQRFKPEHPPRPMSKDGIPSITDESKALSKDLKKRGFKFVGPTTCYAFMQAMGMVNDHIDGCEFSSQ